MVNLHFIQTGIGHLLRIGLFIMLGPTLLWGQYQPLPEPYSGWNLAVQTYSFRHYSLVKSIERAQQAGLTNLEIYPGQPIGGAFAGEFSHRMDASTRLAIKSLLEKEGMRMQSYGVLSNPDSDEWEAIFAFVKEMGGEFVVIEPAEEDLSRIGRLATHFQIKAAIHNHPKPSSYWSPEVVLASVELADSPYVGVCADIGHWFRSDLDPLACLQILDGHIFSVHFKDLMRVPTGMRHQVWGRGDMDIAGVISELMRQDFEGTIVVEYEDDPANNLQQIQQSVEFFRTHLRHKP